MVAFPEKLEKKGGKATMRDETREEIVKEVEKRIKTMGACLTIGIEVVL